MLDILFKNNKNIYAKVYMLIFISIVILIILLLCAYYILPKNYKLTKIDKYNKKNYITINEEKYKIKPNDFKKFKNIDYNNYFIQIKNPNPNSNNNFDFNIYFEDYYRAYCVPFHKDMLFELKYGSDFVIYNKTDKLFSFNIDKKILNTI